MKKFIVRTFGCKTNQYESQGMRELLEGAGFLATESIQDAELAIINTCSVTGRAGATCRNTVRSIKKQNPEIKTLLTGCAVDLDEEWIAELGIDYCVPNTEKHRVLEVLGLTDAHSNATRFGFSINRFAGHTRAFVKVQDGCDNFCSYCTIPAARGKPASRDFDEIISEAQKLSDSGHKELVITGINIGKYDFADKTLADIVRGIGALNNVKRVRLGSIEAVDLDENILLAISETPAACQHIHLPLQSGDDGVLRAMNRNYTTDEFLQKVLMARQMLKNVAITTDIIVGFPSEDEAAFLNACEMCKKAGFSRSHIFPFSPRPGTPAASMKKVIDSAVTDRKKRLAKICDSLVFDYATSFVGNNIDVLIEEEKGGFLYGYSEQYLRARLPLSTGTSGDVVSVKVSGVEGAELVCE